MNNDYLLNYYYHRIDVAKKVQESAQSKWAKNHFFIIEQQLRRTLRYKLACIGVNAVTEK